MGTDNIPKSDIQPGEAPTEPNINELEVGAEVGENSGLERGESDAKKHRKDNKHVALDASSNGLEKGAVNQDALEPNRGDTETEDGELLPDMVIDMDLVDSPVREVHVQVAEVVTVAGDMNTINFGKIADNCSLDLHDGSISRNSRIDRSQVSVVKRARMTYEQQPSVHVKFNYLTRASKQKLEELLQQWSQWHAQCDPSPLDPSEVIESGEETYFPALCVGTEKSSAVSFWIENQMRKQHDSRPTPVEGNFVPLYDRGFSLGLTSADGPCNMAGGSEIVDDAARCFNCGSYIHSLKECSMPRDHVAISNARRLYKSKRNQKSLSRSATRYYESSSGGKFDGLKPGCLDCETRQLLGLTELDPPPWLDRMRELGYPPGYLDPDDEDQPSGITIFADGDDRVEQEDGEIIGMDIPEAPKRKGVVFPGMNAPIPEHADGKLWGVQSSGFNHSNQSHNKMDHFSKPINRRCYPEQKRFSDFIDDGPPGVERRRFSDFIDDGPPGVEPRWFSDFIDDRPPGVERGRFSDFIDDGPPGVERRRFSAFIDDGPPGVEPRRFSDFIDDGPPGVEPRRFGDFIDDGPPGVDLAISPCSYPPRERNTLVYEDFPSYSSSPYSPSRERYYQQKLGYSSFAHESDDWRERHSFHYSYRGHVSDDWRDHHSFHHSFSNYDDYGWHHHRSWR